VEAGEQLLQGLTVVAGQRRTGVNGLRHGAPLSGPSVRVVVRMELYHYRIRPPGPSIGRGRIGPKRCPADAHCPAAVLIKPGGNDRRLRCPSLPPPFSSAALLTSAAPPAAPRRRGRRTARRRGRRSWRPPCAR